MITDEGNYLDRKVKVRPFKMDKSPKQRGIIITNISLVEQKIPQTLSDGRVRLNATGGNKRRRYASTKGFSNLK